MDLATLKKYDPSGMHKIYDSWPELAQESYESKIDAVDFKGIDHMVFAGMGGSGAIGDVFSSILSKTNVHVSVVKGYVLPKTVDSNTLVVTTSISGNTPETLSILESGKKIGCKIIAFSSGGKMQEYCENNTIEYRKIPQFHSPRSSFSGFLYSMLKVLEPLIPVKKEDVVEACHNNIVPWEKWSNATPILIEGNDDHIKTKERWKILKDYFEINKIDYREVFSGKGAILSKLIKLVYLLDYATIYLAIISRSDPSPVRSLDFVKYRLSVQSVDLVNEQFSKDRHRFESKTSI